MAIPIVVAAVDITSKYALTACSLKHLVHVDTFTRPRHIVVVEILVVVVVVVVAVVVVVVVVVDVAVAGRQ